MGRNKKWILSVTICCVLAAAVTGIVLYNHRNKHRIEQVSLGNSGSSVVGETVIPEYKVNFELGIENEKLDISLPQTQTVAAGTAINTLPAPSEQGMIFLGWYYDDALTEGVATGDTVDRDMTLYAKVEKGEEIQPLETPNQVTATGVTGKTYSFEVTGVVGEENIREAVNIVNITDGNEPIEYTVNGSTVTVEIEEGQTYQVELLNEEAKLDEQKESVRYMNILTAKDEVKNASINSSVKQIQFSDDMGLNSNVFAGLYQIRQDGTTTQNATKGTINYDGDLEIGDVIAVTLGAVDLTDAGSTEGDVAYLKITSKNKNGYGYEMAGVKDILFIPDILPIENGWDTDTTDGDILTITAADLKKSMKNVDAEGLNVGDFLCFINGSYSDLATAAAYARITGVTTIGGESMITYELFDSVEEGEQAIEDTLDVYYSDDVDVELTPYEEALVAEAIKKDVIASGYAEQAASYLKTIFEESTEFTRLQDKTQGNGPHIKKTAGGSTAKVEINPRDINVKIRNKTLDHLSGSGFDVEINVPFTVKIGSRTEIKITATFEEEVIMKQNISTTRHKIGFLKYDYSLNATFEVGNYTGIQFTANIATVDGEESQSMIKELDEIMERMEAYHEAGGVAGSDGSVESLAEIYASVMENANDAWIEVFSVKIFETDGNAFLHLFCWEVKASFVVKINLAACVGMSFDYTMQKQYIFSVRLKTETYSNQALDIITPQYNFDFYVVGTTGIRAGLFLEMYVGLVSLSLDKIGLTAEAGAYARLWGYFFYHLTWRQGADKETSYSGAMVIEIGAYLEIKFVAQAFSSNKLTWNPTLYSKEWPLWSIGERQNVFAFEIKDDLEYTVQTVKTLALPGTTYSMKYMDLKSGLISKANKDDASESGFTVSFTNKKFKYDPSTNTVTVTPTDGSLKEETDMTIIWKKSALSFSSNPVKKVIHIIWSDPEGMRYINFDTLGGSSIEQLTGGSGAPLKWPADPTKQGYIFDGWYMNAECTVNYNGLRDKMPTFSEGVKGMTLFAKWKPGTVAYTVEHYKQGINGNYSLAETQKDRTGITGSMTEAYAREYTGYNAQVISQQVIAADGSTVVKAYYDLDICTVTFVPGYGSNNEITKTYRYGEMISAPVMARDLYKFEGWVKQGEVFVPGLPDVVTETATYIGIWTGVDNSISFDTLDGRDVTGITVKTGDLVAKPEDPTRIGYTFEGWYIDTDHQTAWNFETDKVEGPMTLFAKWKINTYTVTLNLQGGSGSASSVKVTYEADMPKIDVPSRIGYKFEGFFDAVDGGKAYYNAEGNSSSKWDKASSATLYAHWTPNSDTVYTVKHYKQDLTGNDYSIVTSDTETLTGTTGKMTAAKARSYNGFTAQTVAQKEIAPDGTTVVTIYYDRDKYTVTWKNGSTILETDQNVRYGEMPSYNGRTPSMSERGYTCNFTGWSPAVTTVTGNVTYEAQFRVSANYYSITYVLNDGSLSGSYPTSYTYGSGTRLPIPTKTGYSFGGWFTNESFTGSAVSSIDWSEIGSKTFYAKWTGNTVGYTVEHYKQNVAGTGYQIVSEDTQKMTGTAGTKTSAAAKTYEGYIAKSFEQETILGTGETVVRIYYDSTGYTVTWKNGDNVLEEDTNVKYGSTPEYNGKTPTKTETGHTYTFTGWTPSITEVTGDAVYTAQFSDSLNQYGITYALNDGSLSGSYPTSYTYGSGATLPLPTKTGFTFAGWFANESLNGSAVTSIGTTETGEKTFYAKWTGNTVEYTVEHYKQNVAGTEYQIVSEDTQKLTGTAGTKTSAAAKTYEGYTAKSFEQETILGTGETVVRIYYDVATYTVTWKNGDKVLEEDTNVKYGSTPEYNGKTPTKTQSGYIFTFKGWTPSITVVTSDVTYTAVFDSEETEATKYTGISGERKLYIAETCVDGSKPIDGVESVEYDGTTDTYTITLNDFDFTGTTKSEVITNRDGSGNCGNEKMIIVLKGENTMKSSAVFWKEDFVIYNRNDLTIRGDGTLNLETYIDYGGGSRGICTDSNLTIEGGTINILVPQEGSAQPSGLYASSVTINGGDISIDIEKDKNGVGIYANSITINGGSVECHTCYQGLSCDPQLAEGVTAVYGTEYDGSDASEEGDYSSQYFYAHD